MRAFLDANLFISYLLAPDGASPPTAILGHAFAAEFTLLVAEPLLEELVRNVTSKPFLANRIGGEELRLFINALMSIAERIELASELIPRVCRDPADDYLLAAAAVGHADYLVSGDRDLLVLDPVGSLRIVTPTEFLTLLTVAR